MNRPKRAFFVCAAGGHLLELLQAEPCAEGLEIHWVVPKKNDAVVLLEGKTVHWAKDCVARVSSRLGFAKNLARFGAVAWDFLQAPLLLLKYRPDRIVSTGSSIAVPYFLLAKLMPGTRTCFVETLARVDGPSPTGRVCARFADLFLYQWEELAPFYPKGVYGGSVF